jgi:hypothetical protein
VIAVRAKRVSLFRRGAGEAIAATIAFAVLSLAIAYIILGAVPRLSIAPSTASGAVLGGVEQLVVIQRGMEVGSNRTIVIEVLNAGSAPVRIDAVLVTVGGTPLLVRLGSKSICNSTQPGVLVPRSSTIIICSREGYKPVGVVTQGGRVFVVNPRIEAYFEKPVGIPMKTLYGGVTVTSTSSLLNLLYNKSILYSNAVNTTIPMTLALNRSSVYVSATLQASLVMVGRNPANNKLNILVIGSATSGNYVSAGTTVSLSRAGALRYRLKIENFTGTIQIGGIPVGPGIYPCLVSTGSSCAVTISSTAPANSVRLYTNTTARTSQAVGLDPYVFVGDIDGDGNTETVFVTQDFTIGDSNSLNDVNRRFGRPALDSSLVPIRLILGSVDGSKYSSAVLSIKFFYWDNSADDINDNDNRVIIRAGLLDPATGAVRYSVALSYYELCRYRQLPFYISYVTKDFLIYIPNESKKFSVFIEFVDSYSNTNTRNDADILVGLSYVGISLVSR